MKSKTMSKAEVISKFKLQPLDPEGGFFKRTYVSKLELGSPLRPSMTSILYLITKEEYSSLHKLKSDEIYHFYAGDDVRLFLINKFGTLEVVDLGNDLINTVPQCLVEKETWQGCKIKDGGSFGWSLLGTTVSPGFDFNDFTLGDRDLLVTLFPSLREIITDLTK